MLEFLSVQALISLPRDERLEYYEKEKALKAEAYDLLGSLITPMLEEESDLVLENLTKRKEKLRKIKELYTDQKFLKMRANLRKLFRESTELLKRKNEAILKRLRDRKRDPEEENYFRRKEAEVKVLANKAEQEMCEFCHQVKVDPSRFLFTYRLWR